MDYINEEMFWRLYRADHGELQGPYNMYLNITIDCPFSCKFCGKKSLIPGEGANFEVFRFLVNVVLRAGIDDDGLRELYGRGINSLRSAIENDSILRGAVSEIESILKETKPLDFDVYSGKIRAIVQRGDIRARDRFPEFAALVGFILNDRIYSDYKTMMTLAEYKNLLREAAELGVRRIFLSGSVGEPLVEKEKTMDIMAYIKKLGMEGVITTNGFYVDREFAEFAVKIGWDMMIVSLDAARASVHDALRGVTGAFAGVMRTLDLIREMKEKYGSERPYININFVLNRHNYKDIPDLVDLAIEKGVNILDISPMTLHRREDLEDLVLGDEEKRELEGILKEALRKLENHPEIESNIGNIVLSLKDLYSFSLLGDERAINEIEKEFEFLHGKYPGDLPDKGIENAYCLEPWLSITVETNGAVRICCFPYVLLINENVRQKSLREIWYGERYELVRRRMLSDIPVECKYNCLPSVRKYQELSIREYRRIKAIVDSTHEAPEWLASILRKAEGRLGSRKHSLRRMILSMGLRYLPLSEY